MELKADQDVHLPLPGLDYWSRVKSHIARASFFVSGISAAQNSPLKIAAFSRGLALHVHPAIDTLLRYFAPEIELEFLGIDERWREGAKVVFRKPPDRN